MVINLVVRSNNVIRIAAKNSYTNTNHELYYYFFSGSKRVKKKQTHPAPPAVCAPLDDPRDDFVGHLAAVLLPVLPVLLGAAGIIAPGAVSQKD
mmetsp:Transcript_53026/g.77457  ORF Transcript_53026/g.77457 Transcript_53026/m.77457 type:complete len:94 (-) Transcript_53026:1260-1541(-)